MSRILMMVFCCFYLVSVCSAADFLDEGTDRPNIILVMADDQGWGQTGYQGHPRLKTPHLDAMAANGLRFNRFYAAAPVCSPTRASVLTGRTNRRTGVETHGYALRRQEATIAKELQQAGYRTGHFGKWHLNGLRGPGAPILGDDTHHPGVFGFDEWLSVTNFFDRDPLLSRRGSFEDFKGDSSEIVVAEAIRFMEKQIRDKRPFFTVIWFGTPHDPFVAAEQDMEPFADLEPRTRKQLGELVAMDRSIGTLRDALRKEGVEKNTLVWFTSDNGGLPRMNPSTTGGLRGFKRSLYEGGLRVPAIIEWPDEIKPRVTDFPAVSMDIFPTLKEVAELPEKGAVLPQDGISLLPLFRTELLEREKPIPFSFLDQLVIIDNRYKFMWVGEKKPRYELYDLVSDPTESRNLLETEKGLAATMKQQLQEFEASLKASIEGADYPEGKVLPGEPGPTSWMTDDRYKPFLDDWRKRPEFRPWLKQK